MPSIPTRNPLIERSNMVVLLTLYYKRKSINHVSWGTVIGCFAFLKRSKEADGVLNIEDAYSMRVYLVGFPKQLNYVRLLYWLILNIFRRRLINSSVLDILVLPCIDKLLFQDEKKLSSNFNMRKKKN
jgi:hypothetical protein